jgi:hypothetical protein
MPFSIPGTGPISLIAIGEEIDRAEETGPYKLRNYYRRISRRETVTNGVLGESETGRGVYPTGGQILSSYSRKPRTGSLRGWGGNSQNYVGAVYVSRNFGGNNPNYNPFELWLWYGNNGQQFNWVTYGVTAGTYVPASDSGWDATLSFGGPAFTSRRPYASSLASNPTETYIVHQSSTPCDNPTQADIGIFGNQTIYPSDGSVTVQQWYKIDTQINIGSSYTTHNTAIQSNFSSPIKMSQFRAAADTKN